MTDQVIGRVDSVWRYPVKGMRGERMSSAALGANGLPSDRLYAFHHGDAPKHFPYFTARDQPAMLLFQPLALAGGAAVRLPSGEVLSLHDPALIAALRRGSRITAPITLQRSPKGMQDSHPVSLLSLQTVRQLGDELGRPLDPRRFRATFLLDLEGAEGFAEDALVGRILRIGATATLAVTERDRRCKMITLDPDTAEADPAVLRHVMQAHEGMTGVYARVVSEGIVQPGDTVVLAKVDTALPTI